MPPSVELSAEEKYRRWLGERFEASTRQLCALAHHARPAVSQLAVVTLMNLVQAQHWRATSKPEGDTYKVPLFSFKQCCESVNPDPAIQVNPDPDADPG